LWFNLGNPKSETSVREFSLLTLFCCVLNHQAVGVIMLILGYKQYQNGDGDGNEDGDGSQERDED
jgi:hypothetical protein